MICLDISWHAPWHFPHCFYLMALLMQLVCIRIEVVVTVCFLYFILLNIDSLLYFAANLLSSYLSRTLMLRAFKCAECTLKSCSLMSISFLLNLFIMVFFQFPSICNCIFLTFKRFPVSQPVVSLFLALLFVKKVMFELHR